MNVKERKKETKRRRLTLYIFVQEYPKLCHVAWKLNNRFKLTNLPPPAERYRFKFVFLKCKVKENR